MPKTLLPSTGPIIAHVELIGPQASRVVTMALDTGAELTVIPNAVALEIGYDPRHSIKHISMLTASGAVFVPQMTLHSAIWLGKAVSNLEVICHNLPAQIRIEGLLGLNFLRHFNTHLNFLDKTLELHAPGPSKTAAK